MAKATDQSTNSSVTPQMPPDELSALARRLRVRADSVLLRDQPEQQADLRQAAGLIERLMRTSTDILVDIAGDVRTTRRNVPLREAIGDDEVEYEDCRQTLLAEGKCTTGGGAAPIYHLTLAGNDELARVRAEIRRVIQSTNDDDIRPLLTDLLGGE